MRGLFEGCIELTTIYASLGFSTQNVKNSFGQRYLFKDCKKLVGGAGFTYNEEIYTLGTYNSGVDISYAYIDKRLGEGDYPGYFTEKPKN